MRIYEHLFIAQRSESQETGDPVKIRDIIKTVEADGWVHVKTKGSHRQFKHPLKPGRVTIPGHPGDDVKLDTLKSILTQAGLRGKP